MDIPLAIFTSVIVFQWLVYFWDTYVSWRQYVVTKKNTKVPPELIGIVDEETMEKARAYALDKARYSFWHGLYSQIEITVILCFDLIPIVWYATNNLFKDLGYENEILNSMVFLLLSSFYSLVTGFPWSVYSTFVIEEKHGFNKQTFRFFIWDMIKKFIVLQIIMLPLIALLIVIIQKGGDFFFIYAWLFVLVISIAIITIYPPYIAPLFDKYVPLPESPLRTSIQTLTDSVNFPLSEMFVVEGSKRSAHSNAYFIGLIKKRIVLFDTLLLNFPPTDEADQSKLIEEVEVKKKKGCSDPEVLAVLGHELGHWKLWHVPKNFVFMQFNILINFLVFALLYKNDAIYEAFGFMNSKPTLIGLFIIFQFIFQPYEELLNCIITYCSRRFELQADGFVVKLTNEGKLTDGVENLKKALLKLHVDNLSFPYNDWLYSAIHYSHPPLLDRLRALEAFGKKHK